MSLQEEQEQDLKEEALESETNTIADLIDIVRFCVNHPFATIGFTGVIIGPAITHLTRSDITDNIHTDAELLAGTITLLGFISLFCTIMNRWGDSDLEG